MIGLLRAARAAFGALAAAVPELDTAGGDPDEPDDDEWDGGRYRGARWAPIHPGRVGGAIAPWGVVVHTTDMHPSTFGALIRAWQRDAGRGAGAHFLIGRSAREGVVQLVDVGRNANHAGGRPAHGWFEVNDGARVHPNRVTVGIEVHAAGAVRWVGGEWRCYSGGRPVGAPLPAAEVQPDPRRPGRGWHVATAYQLDEIARLLDALAARAGRALPPDSYRIVPHGAPQAWAPHVRWCDRLPVVGHVTLDPARKSDPGPPLSDWLRARAGAEPIL